MRPAKPPRLPIVAFGEWLMILPATVFLAAAALRLLQPRQFEPARTSWLIVDWIGAHVSRFDAAILFLALPVFAGLAGCAALARAWRHNDELRKDAALAVTLLRRHLTVILISAATVLASAISVFIVAHVITD